MRKNIIWKILIYFIFYSILGFFLETLFALVTKGVLESRQSFLYGPFCIVYGIGAICLILTLNKYKDNNLKLLLYGMIVGATVEYLTSYIGELMMHIKWWDYSNDFLNIHGRTCLFYGVCWGILTILLIKYINPFLDKQIDKVFSKGSISFLKVVITSITLFMVIDGIISFYALDNFLARVSDEYNIKFVGVEEKSSKITTKLFSNEKIMMTYPNMLVMNDNDEIIQLKILLSDTKNYYYKFRK